MRRESMPGTARGAVLALVLAVATAVAACGGSGPAPASPAGSAPAPATAPPATPGPPDAATAVPSTGASAAPASPAPASADPTPNPAAAALAGSPWAGVELIDVATGEAFTIAGLAGRPVFVEMMAIWCTNCRQQQARFTEAFGQLAPGLAEYVVLTVEPSETAEDLARYREARGFTGRYAVAGTVLAKALRDAFGPNALNPPSVPLVFVAPDGQVTFSTGPESVERIVELAGA